jgi:AraC-like DNA-binding protein
MSIAIILAGTFQYRSHSNGSAASELMTPGALLLGNAGQYFVCSHEHGAGDRCLSFQFTPECFETLVSDSGCARTQFERLRVPATREFSSLMARASVAMAESSSETWAGDSWQELSVRIALQTLRFANGVSSGNNDVGPSAVRRVAETVRRIEEHSHSELSLESMAREAGLSPYYFLRTFERLTNVTPHQYVRRMRLREAAVRLLSEPSKILDIALDCGFGDVSNFNRAFRAEFGINPRAYRSGA